MDNLLSLVKGYLMSDGYRVLEEQEECLVARKMTTGYEEDTRIIWTVPSEEYAKRYEGILLGSIPKLSQKYPEAKSIVLAGTRAGFSRRLIHGLTDLRANLRVAAHYFDLPFKDDETPEARKAGTIVRNIVEKGMTLRVPQPFHSEDSDESDNDLLDVLVDDLSQTIRSPAIRIVVGQAGIGKTWLFRALFSRLYETFQGRKAKQELGLRPIPLIPEYLRNSVSFRTENLIDNFLRTEVAAAVHPGTFQWLLVNGFTSWLFDGLDELYVEDPQFFEELGDYVTRPGSKAQIIIFCRDSVLTTSSAFADFRDYCRNSALVQIYKLAPWERTSKRNFAWLQFEEKLPTSGHVDTKEVDGFLTAIDQTETLTALSKLPFYCSLLLDQYREKEALDSFNHDVDLLEYVIECMIEREKEKKVLDIDLFEPNGLDDWLQQIAANYLESGYSDIDINEAILYGKVVLRDGVSEQDENHVLTSLLQFPLFRPGADVGRFSFDHELIAEVLASRKYLDTLSKQPITVARILSTSPLQDATIHHFIAARLVEKQRTAIRKALHVEELSGRTFGVLLTLLMLSSEDPEMMQNLTASMEERDLSGAVFKNLNLSKLSFRNSDLSFCVFDGCDLRETHFENAVMVATKFENRIQLEGAHFGNLSRIQSINYNKRNIEEFEKLREWLEEATGHIEPLQDPCPTALQVQHIFRRFITPLGENRQSKHAHKVLISGRRYQGAVPSSQCVEEMLKAGYLLQPDIYDNYRCAQGDRFGEIVRLVRDSSISAGLGELISALCARRACIHQIVASTDHGSAGT